jgi:hypothetical protein
LFNDNHQNIKLNYFYSFEFSKKFKVNKLNQYIYKSSSKKRFYILIINNLKPHHKQTNKSDSEEFSPRIAEVLKKSVLIIKTRYMNKQVITFCDGKGEEASFDEPYGVTIYNDQIIVADTENHRIRLIDMNTREVSILAGSGRRAYKDGKGEEASFNDPWVLQFIMIKW